MANWAKQMNTPPEASPAESVVLGGVVSEQAEVGGLNWKNKLESATASLGDLQLEAEHF